MAAGKVFGFFFYKRTNTTVFVRESEGGQLCEREYEILNILEFDSTRKRMTVICRSPEGKLKLYCKVTCSVLHAAVSGLRNPNTLLLFICLGFCFGPCMQPTHKSVRSCWSSSLTSQLQAIVD